MTPHHPDYNSKQGAQPPADTDEPVPVQYLTVVGRFFFVLRLRWREETIDEECRDNYRQWLEVATRLLRETLENAGLGGKKSQGYGLFTPTSGGPGSDQGPGRDQAPTARQDPPGHPQLSPAARHLIAAIGGTGTRDLLGRLDGWRMQRGKLPSVADREAAGEAIQKRLCLWQQKYPVGFEEQARRHPWIRQMLDEH